MINPETKISIVEDRIVSYNCQRQRHWHAHRNLRRIAGQRQPEAAIRREAEEETGYQLGTIKKVFEVYMSPGSVTEIVYFFVAPYTKALEMIASGGIKDGKTIILLQYAQLNKLL